MLLGSANLSNVGISYQGANKTCNNDCGRTPFSHCCIKAAERRQWYQLEPRPSPPAQRLCFCYQSGDAVTPCHSGVITFLPSSLGSLSVFFGWVCWQSVRPPGAALAVRAPRWRSGSMTDLRAALLCLASDACDCLTGHNLVIDGGQSLRVEGGRWRDERGFFSLRLLLGLLSDAADKDALLINANVNKTTLSTHRK